MQKTLTPRLYKQVVLGQYSTELLVQGRLDPFAQHRP